MDKRYFIGFAVGTVVGGLGAWYFAKRHYETIANNEIESVKESFAKIERDRQTKNVELARKAKEIADVKEIIEEQGYSDGEDTTITEPYIIPPEDYDELDDYQACSLTYYTDGILVENDTNDVIEKEQIVQIIGNHALEHFGEYEADSVYVRNDERRCDYEILREDKDYFPTSS